MTDTQKIKIEILTKFLEFIRKDISEAIKELEKINVEKNRSHLQKLVYIDLVNRFDSLVDSLLIASAEESTLQDKILETWKETPVYKKELFQLLKEDDPESKINEQILGEMRSRFLSRRHSDKLILLLKDSFGWSDSELQRPRVDNNGYIGDNMRRANRKNPLQVPGYADWVYSRRNAMVHGSGNKMIEQDMKIIQRKFNTKVASTISIRLNSIQTLVKFYSSLCQKMLERVRADAN